MSATWHIIDGVFTHSSLPDMIPRLVPPYPAGIWYIDDGIFKHALLPSMIGSDNRGAFCGVNTLVSVKIPRTVQQIGAFSFDGTSLTSVKISQYCNYDSTSFPEECEITYYE